jgi:hypothetical protein
MRFVVLALVALLLPVTARAQLYPFREHLRLLDTGRLAVGSDSAVFFGKVGDEQRALVQPTLLAGFRIWELVLTGALPLAYYHSADGADGNLTKLALGNPWGEASYLPDCACGLSRLSVGAGLPAATASPLGAQALSVARGAHGNWDGYLYMPDFLPLVFGASTRMERGRLLFLWDGDVIVGMPGRGRDLELATQHAGEADLRFGWDMTLGARISATYYPTLPGDKFQSAMTAFFRYAWVDNTLVMRMVLNLDGPAGPAFGQRGMWGAGLHYVRSLL